MPTFSQIVEAAAGLFVAGLMALAFDAIRTTYSGLKSPRRKTHEDR